MQKQINDVQTFIKAFEQPMNTEPSLIPNDVWSLRYKLMKEENEEYVEACEAEDIVGIADALGDQLYILLGTILTHGLQDKIEEVFSEIQRSNMSKLDANGKPIYREDGKVLKGPAYFKPDLKSIIIKKEE